jgi:iron complex transport system substrate-binding protein
VKFPRDRVTVTARTPARLHLPSEMFRVKTSAAGHGKFFKFTLFFASDGCEEQGVFILILDKTVVVFSIMMIQFRILLAAAFASTLFVSACDTKLQVPSPNTGYQVVKDDLGREVSLPKVINRAVSLAPNITEMIFAADAGNKLVGDTTYCNYPEEAKAIQKVGDTLNPNLETIVGLKPDVVFVSSASQLENFTKLLQQNRIAVYVTNPSSINDVMNDLLQFGRLFGTIDQTGEIVSEIDRRQAAVSRTVSGADKLNVFVQISREPLFTVGKQSFLKDMVDKAGGMLTTDNIDSAYPKLSKETAIALQPEAIILSDSPDNQEPNDAFKNSPAFKNGRVFKINADIISRPGPRLVDALEQIARYLHPEKFQ